MASFVRDGLTRAHKVLYLRDEENLPLLSARMDSWDPRVAAALGRGQIEVRSVRETYLSDGELRPDLVLQILREEHETARAAGFTALSTTGEMTFLLTSRHGKDRLPDFERQLDEATEGGSLMLCQYDQSRFDDGTGTELGAMHGVDISPELALIAYDSQVSGARIRGGLLRLSGALDFSAADVVSLVLDSHFAGDLRLDLLDLDFIDVAGLRALRGQNDRGLSIDPISEPVRRMLDLLGSDEAPEVS
ncbi:MAG: hypothetical protein QOH76_1113 [Thermoleophilaceae bacterium]|nr:hypothetical protein [Thermoleophilaceae bacterium]